MPARIGAMLPRASGGWIGAIEGVGLVALDNDLTIGDTLAHPEPDRAHNRYNDGAIDPAGRLWIGTMHTDACTPSGALYRVDIDHTVTRVLDNLTISNGIAWSPDARTMYHIDTPTKRIDAYDFDMTTGTIDNRRTAATVDEGYPDGMTVDRDGGLWVALWGGGRVVRFDPQSGESTDEVYTGCANATSCCFAGPDLATLVITTAGRDTPHAGALLGVRTGRVGMESSLFAG